MTKGFIVRFARMDRWHMGHLFTTYKGRYKRTKMQSSREEWLAGLRGHIKRISKRDIPVQVTEGGFDGRIRSRIYD